MLSANQAAAILNLSPQRVRAIARSRKVGRKVGRDWVFTKAEIALLKPGPPGWPKGKSRH